MCHGRLVRPCALLEKHWQQAASGTIDACLLTSLCPLLHCAWSTNMALKIGINGFGRIGRLVLRAGLQNPNLEFVGVNDLFPPENLAYLLKFDSTHGRFPGSVEPREGGIQVNGKLLKCSAIKNPAELPWKSLGVQYVVESTG